MNSKQNPAALRLLGKTEVLQIVGVSYPTLWAWMCAGKFPRARISGGGRANNKSVWRSDEVERWLAKLPMRPLKGDAELLDAPKVTGRRGRSRKAEGAAEAQA